LIEELTKHEEGKGEKERKRGLTKATAKTQQQQEGGGVSDCCGQEQGDAYLFYNKKEEPFSVKELQTGAEGGTFN